VSAAKFVFLVFMSVAIADGPAFAQGRSDSAPGQSTTPGKTKDKTTSSSTPKSSGGSSSLAGQSGIASPVSASASTSAPASSANALIYYGSWLDDASIVAPGDVWIGLSTGYWRGQGNRQIDAPVASAAVGINSRIQAGGSFSFYHFRDPEGLSETGPGNMSVYGKFLLFDPAASSKGVGLAITPLVELSPSAEEELGWALPVNLEVRRGSSRFYGSAGYFSRGATFATVGVDFPVGTRLALTGSFGQSYASAGTHQTSFSVGTFVSMGSTTGAFIGLGQTFMPDSVGPGGVSLAGGFSFLLPQPTRP
jgi:hypothetical protein